MLYWVFPVICSSLYILELFLIFIIILSVVIPIYHDFPMVEFMIDTIEFLGYKLDCPWYDHPPHSLLIFNKLLTLT